MHESPCPTPDVVVIGAGLAGSEAAWQLAEAGFQVLLQEMRPHKMTPAHQSAQAAEMVCSNSFKGDDPNSATGILKAELEHLGSMILQEARTHRVPAGLSLAVDRERFSAAVTQRLQSHPRIQWKTTEVTEPPLDVPTILATGPLTSDPLADWISRLCGEDRLHFYDAIAPVIERDSLDDSIVFPASRYDKGSADFLNCPLNRDQYEAFLDALLAAERAPLHDFDTPYFEACLPIEVMAERGRETLRHGPMKPVGLTDPRTGRWPYAAVQLRQDSLAGDLFNMVGFQTRLAWGAQKEVFRLIPGLEHAAFARLGSIHRNTYVCAPKVLDATLQCLHHPRLWFAGQVSGVEGYLESAASGLAAARAVTAVLRGGPAVPLPVDTMLGTLLHHISHSPAKGFSPVNAMLGLLPPLPEGTLDIRALKRAGGTPAVKAAKGSACRERSLAALRAWSQA